LQQLEDEKSDISAKLQQLEDEKSDISAKLQQYEAKNSWLEKELESMRRSITWQAVMKFHGGVIERAFPHGTMFRSSYDSGLNRARIIVNNGLGKFVSEFAQHHFNTLPYSMSDSVNPQCNMCQQEIIVSVVVPIYDGTWELRECIQSILDQSFENFELILVTDGSPDETIKVVEEYSSHPKVRIFRYYNNTGNAVRGRNKGSGGPWKVHSLDSDDIATPERLKLSVMRWKDRLM
jgi:hypothetical protein